MFLAAPRCSSIQHEYTKRDNQWRLSNLGEDSHRQTHVPFLTCVITLQSVTAMQTSSGKLLAKPPGETSDGVKSTCMFVVVVLALVALGLNYSTF